MKNNIDYYPHDVNSHNHWKFKALRRRYGWAGEGKFWALNNMIAKADCCQLDLNREALRKEVAAELDFELKELDEFIDQLVQCELIRCNNSIITTDTVQRTFHGVSTKRGKDRERKRIFDENSARKIEEEENIPHGILTKKSKEKETKEEETKEEETKEKEKEKETSGKSENLLREDLLIPQMAELWRNTFPKYTFDQAKDYEALGAILRFMMQQVGNHDPTDTDLQIKALNTLQHIADVIRDDPFWCNKPLLSIAKNIQEFFNRIKNPQGGKQGVTAKKLVDSESLKRKLVERFGNR